MPCICLPCTRWRRAPVESYMKFFFATVGLLGEIITGIKFYSPPQPMMDKLFPQAQHGDSHSHDGMGMDSHSHVHKRSAGGHEPLVPEMPVKSWYFEYVNQQHSTMYSAFILGSIVEIMVHHKVNLPAKIEYVCGILGFAIEAFLFANHLHSRAPLDIHVHTLLVYAIYGCVIFSILEAYDPSNILFTYGRIMFTLFQGTWFCQVGFILYPPIDIPILKWDPYDHNQIMTITMSYCWHAILIVSGLIIQLLIMQRIYGSSKKIANEWDELIIIDHDNNSGSNALNVHAYITSDNGVETKFLSVNSDEENSDDERIEFDTTKLIKQNKENVKMIRLDEKANSPSSSSSSTSGNYSANASC
jgi:hypothetical protein